MDSLVSAKDFECERTYAIGKSLWYHQEVYIKITMEISLTHTYIYIVVLKGLNEIVHYIKWNTQQMVIYRRQNIVEIILERQEDSEKNFKL